MNPDYDSAVIRLDFTDLNPFFNQPTTKHTIQKPIQSTAQKIENPVSYPNLVSKPNPHRETLKCSLNALKGQYTWICDAQAPGRASIVVFAKGKNDVYISFAENQSNKSYLYEIVFGAYDNTQSILRRCAQGKILDKKGTKGICDEKVGAYFWANVEQGVVTAGKGQRIGYDILLTYVDSDPLNVKYIGLSSWDKKIEYEYTKTLD